MFFSFNKNTILSKCLENICLQNQMIKYQKSVSKKKQNYCLKSSQNARKSHRSFKKFSGGGMPPDPLGWLRAYGPRIRAFGAQFLPHQPRVDGYVSAKGNLYTLLCKPIRKLNAYSRLFIPEQTSFYFVKIALFMMKCQAVR